jgi:hypothetical protein
MRLEGLRKLKKKKNDFTSSAPALATFLLVA